MDSRGPQVIIVLDASVALAWQIHRADPAEELLATKALVQVEMYGAIVPVLWYAEVANGLLVAERKGVSTERSTASFLADLAQMPIDPDVASPSSLPGELVLTGRMCSVTAYDAAYLELALRTGRALATFDRKLAQAARSAGVQVFGDPI
jgi:predicted nucleic acid-binding protein